VKVVQFVRPNGAQREVEIAVKEDAETMAAELSKLGVRFEVEVLQHTGDLSFEACGPEDEDGDEISWAHTFLEGVTSAALEDQDIAAAMEDAHAATEIRQCLDALVREAVGEVAAARDASDDGASS
jgi:hypothetical protein